MGPYHRSSPLSVLALAWTPPIGGAAGVRRFQLLASEGLPHGRSWTGQVITLLCLVAVFIAAVLITPRIWHANDRVKEAQKKRGNSSI
jgi:hypothetical protein